jgi:hypothetical protein
MRKLNASCTKNHAFALVARGGCRGMDTVTFKGNGGMTKSTK